jgi:hypothetical protein
MVLARASDNNTIDAPRSDQGVHQLKEAGYEYVCEMDRRPSTFRKTKFFTNSNYALPEMNQIDANSQIYTDRLPLVNCIAKV